MSSEPKKLCIIHSLADSQQVGELVKRLRPLTDRTALELWHLGAVSAGTDLQEQLTAFLPQAIGVVIWISPDLWESPLYSLLRQNTTLLSPQTIVVPVLARHDSSWEVEELLKRNASHLLPTDRQPIPTDSVERDAWLSKIANGIAVKIGIAPQQRLTRNPFWQKRNFWAWLVPILVPMLVGVYFAYPSFIADSHENEEYVASKKGAIQLPKPGCGFPAEFDSTHLYILITRFEDYANSNETECYGRGIESRIDFIKNRDNLPIKICYVDSLSPNQSDDAASRRDHYYADLIVWGKLHNANANCQADGFCIKFQPSDTLVHYAGGQVSKKIDDEYQPNISGRDVEEGLISMGKESFDAWLITMSNLKIGKKKPEFYRISSDWSLEKQAQEYEKRANMFFGVGLLEKAIQDYDQAIKCRPSYIFYFRRGIAFTKIDQYEKSLKDFNEAIVLKSDDPSIYYNRGKAYMFLDHPQEAIADFNKAIQIDSNYASAYNMIGMTKSNQNLPEKAIIFFDKAISLSPKNAILYSNRAGVKNKLRLFEQAIVDYDKVIQIEPNNALAYSARGNAKNDLGQHDDAKIDFDKAIQLSPNNIDLYVNMAAVNNNSGFHHLALIDYNKIIQLDPNNIDAYIHRGATKAKLGQHKAAIIDFDQAIQMDSTKPQIYNARSDAKYELGLYKEAIADLNKSIHLDPSNIGQYHNRAFFMSKIGLYDAALADLDKVIQLQPKNSNAYNRRGIVKNRLSQYTSALADFEKVLQLEPNAAIYNERGVAKRGLGQYQEAIADFNKAIKYEPNNTEAYENRGNTYWNHGKYLPATLDCWQVLRLQYLAGWRLYAAVATLIGLFTFWRFKKRKKQPTLKARQYAVKTRVRPSGLDTSKKKGKKR